MLQKTQWGLIFQSQEEVPGTHFATKPGHISHFSLCVIIGSSWQPGSVVPVIAKSPTENNSRNSNKEVGLVQKTKATCA